MNAPGPGRTPVAAEHVFDWLDAEAARRSTAGLARTLTPRTASDDHLDLASDDHLGLSRDKRVAGAAAAAALRWGAGATGSRLTTGSTELHAELEYELARFAGAQAALVFSSGFAANLGAVTALTGSDAAIVTDRHVHPSLVEGCRLSRAEVAAVEHRDPDAVEHALRTRRRPRALVVTDSVFSVEGDLAPLSELAAVCRRQSAALLVDDAHGLGVLGDDGRGAVHAAGLSGEPDVVATVTLSASLGAQGGAVLGPRRVIKHIVDTARGFVLATALAPASTAAALAALRVLRDEPGLPEQVRANAVGLAGRLTEAGLAVGVPAGAIVSLPAPGPAEAADWAARCTERGVRVACVHPPTVPDGVSRLRLTARADLSESDLDRAATTITETAPHGSRG